MSDIQSVVFLRTGNWNPTKARAWLKSNKLKPIKHVDKVYVGGTVSQFRYRIKDPNKFKSFSTKKLKGGINLIIGYY
jgi:hypothetical protein